MKITIHKTALNISFNGEYYEIETNGLTQEDKNLIIKLSGQDFAGELEDLRAEHEWLRAEYDRLQEIKEELESDLQKLEEDYESLARCLPEF